MKHLNIVLILAGLFFSTASWGAEHGSSKKQKKNEWLNYKQKNKDAKQKRKAEKHDGRVTESAIETEPENWYVRLTAEVPARGLSTENAQLGQLNRSDASGENLAALNPFGGSYIDIVLMETNTAQELKGSFHPSALGTADSWRFMLKTDDTNSNVILSWRGLYVLEPYTDTSGRQRYREHISRTNPLLTKMQIVDESSGEVVPVVQEAGKSYLLFNMEGAKTRTFRWELLPFESTASEGGSELTVKYARKFFKRYESAARKEFDLGKPPKREEWPEVAPKNVRKKDR